MSLAHHFDDQVPDFKVVDPQNPRVFLTVNNRARWGQKGMWFTFHNGYSSISNAQPDDLSLGMIETLQASFRENGYDQQVALLDLLAQEFQARNDAAVPTVTRSYKDWPGVSHQDPRGPLQAL